MPGANTRKDTMLEYSFFSPTPHQIVHYYFRSCLFTQKCLLLAETEYCNCNLKRQSYVFVPLSNVISKYLFIFLSSCKFYFHRDASFGNCTYNLTILDCLQGLKKVTQSVFEIKILSLAHANKGVPKGGTWHQLCHQSN